MFIYKFRGKRLICKKKQTNKQIKTMLVGNTSIYSVHVLQEDMTLNFRQKNMQRKKQKKKVMRMEKKVSLIINFSY